MTNDEVWSIGADGLPQKCKVVKWNAASPYDKQLIPIYNQCICCNLAVSRLEEENWEELGHYCIDCFKNITGQKEPSPFGEVFCPNGFCYKEVQVEEVPESVEQKVQKPKRKGRLKIGKM